MTTITIEQERVDDLLRACNLLGLRFPDLGNTPSEPTRTVTWTPDLSTVEQNMLRAAVGAVRLTRAERDALQADIDGLTTYQGLATPTLAQTAAAVKAINRILKAVLRS